VHSVDDGQGGAKLRDRSLEVGDVELLPGHRTFIVHCRGDVGAGNRLGGEALSGGPAAPPALVDEEVPGHGEQPPQHPLPGHVRRPPAQHAQVGVVDQILGVGMTAGEPQGEPVQRPPVHAGHLLQDGAHLWSGNGRSPPRVTHLS
jgi:hypothetical protein